MTMAELSVLVMTLFSAGALFGAAIVTMWGSK